MLHDRKRDCSLARQQSQVEGLPSRYGRRGNPLPLPTGGQEFAHFQHVGVAGGQALVDHRRVVVGPADQFAQRHDHAHVNVGAGFALAVQIHRLFQELVGQSVDHRRLAHQRRLRLGIGVGAARKLDDIGTHGRIPGLVGQPPDYPSQIVNGHLTLPCGLANAGGFAGPVVA